MYTKTLAAVLVIATAHASRLTARAGGRGDVSTTSASSSSTATTESLSHWWPHTCEVRKTFSANAPELWWAMSVPDLMDCTEAQSETGTWQNDAEYRLTLSGYDSICRAHEVVGNVTNYKYECLEAGWYPTDDYNDAWCNDYDRKYYEYTKDPNFPDCVKWQTDFSDPDLPLVCNDFNRWVCPPEFSGKWSDSGNYYCTETGAWTTGPIGGTLTPNPNASSNMVGGSSGTWPPVEQKDPWCHWVDPTPSPPVEPPVLPPITPILPGVTDCPKGAHKDCDPATWGPPPGCQPGMVGCDGCSWAPHHDAYCPPGFVGCDTSVWGPIDAVPCPPDAGIGCDPRTWGPTTGCVKGQLGCEPSTWGPGNGTSPVCPQGYVNCDPSGWDVIIEPPTLPRIWPEECAKWEHQTTTIFEDYPFTCVQYGDNYWWDCSSYGWTKRQGDNPYKEELWCDGMYYQWNESSMS